MIEWIRSIIYLVAAVLILAGLVFQIAAWVS